MAISLDLRKRIIAAWQAGQSTRQLAARFAVSERTVRVLKRRFEAGELEPKRPGPRRPTKITPADEALMRQMIKNKPDIILKELAAAISVDVAESTIHRALVRMNITLKKSRSSPANNNAST